MSEVNIWGGEPPKKAGEVLRKEDILPDSAPKVEQAAPIIPKVSETGQSVEDEAKEHRYVLSDDGSGHYVPDAYTRMLERLKGKEAPGMLRADSGYEQAKPKIEYKKPDELELPKEKIGGGEKYRELLIKGRIAVSENESSIYFILTPKKWGNILCLPAGKSKFGEQIFEITEDNVTIGFSDHDITSDFKNGGEPRYH